MKPTPKEVEALLESIEDFEMTLPEKYAFNYLIEYTEFGHLDGERLFSLCMDLMKEIAKRNNK